MNKSQYEQAKKLLTKDCEVRHYYMVKVDKNGKVTHQTCAVGCLAKAAGVRSQTLLKMHNDVIGDNGCKIAVTAIRKKFGLTLDNLRELQDANDGYEFRTDRVDSVLARLKAIYEDC